MLGDLSPESGMAMVPSRLLWYVAQDFQRISPAGVGGSPRPLPWAASALDERPGDMQCEGSSSGRTNMGNYPLD